MKRSIRSSLLALACAGTFHCTPAAAATSCSRELSQHIPQREADAPGAGAFISATSRLDEDTREFAIRSAFMGGNVPDFLRQLQPVRFGDADRGIELVLCVTPDYLALGSDQDYLLTPMRLATALTIAQRYGFVLPTPRMVDAIYRQSQVRLAPQPLPPGDDMRSTAYYDRHNRMVLQQRSGVGARQGELTAGDKKDLVLTNRLWRMPQRVAIYGWHRADQQPIQPLSTVHGERYADYSHGVRLISATAYLNGQPRPVVELLQDPQLAPLLSDEGAIPRLSALVAALGTRPARQVATSARRPSAQLPLADAFKLGR